MTRTSTISGGRIELPSGRKVAESDLLKGLGDPKQTPDFYELVALQHGRLAASGDANPQRPWPRSAASHSAPPKAGSRRPAPAASSRRGAGGGLGSDASARWRRLGLATRADGGYRAMAHRGLDGARRAPASPPAAPGRPLPLPRSRGRHPADLRTPPGWRWGSCQQGRGADVRQITRRWCEVASRPERHRVVRFSARIGDPLKKGTTS